MRALEQVYMWAFVKTVIYISVPFCFPGVF